MCISTTSSSRSRRTAAESCPRARSRIASWVAPCAVHRGDDGAAVHDGDPVAHAEDLGQLGRDHQDRQALGGQLAHQSVDLGLGADVDALRRLVEDQQARARGQPPRQRDLLLVAAREVADRGVEVGRLDPQPADEIPRPWRARGGRRSGRAASGRAGSPRSCWPPWTSRGSPRGGGDPRAHRRSPSPRPAPASRSPPPGRRAGSSPASAGRQAEQDPRQLGAARADQAGQAQHLAGAHARA